MSLPESPCAAAGGYLGCRDTSYTCPDAYIAMCTGAWSKTSSGGVSGYPYAAEVLCNRNVDFTKTVWVSENVTSRFCTTTGCVQSGSGEAAACKTSAGASCDWGTLTYAVSVAYYSPINCPTVSPWPAWGWTNPCPSNPPAAYPPLPPSPPAPPPFPPAPGFSPAPALPAAPSTNESTTCTDSDGGSCTLNWWARRG